MAIFIDRQTRIIIQGFTGKIGTFHAEAMLDYGSNIVGGVTPGKGGESHIGRPVFNTAEDAVAQEGATASIIFVPPAFAADAIMEAAQAQIKYCVAITDGIPTQDMMKVKQFLRQFPEDKRMRLTGPNCAGTISPGQSMLGIMPGHIYTAGKVGVVGRSGTLGYEAAVQLKELGIGISTSVGIGGDPINGSSHCDILRKFNEDDDTDAVLMIGEIGGEQELEAGIYANKNMDKPVVAYIAGLTAPKGRRMGHAGAIISSPGDEAAQKVAMLQDLGIAIAPTPAAMGATVAKVLAK